MAVLWHLARVRNAAVDALFKITLGKPAAVIPLERVGGGYGGFWVPADLLARGQGLLISGGIGFDVHFERAFANAGYEVIALDPLEDCVAFAREQLPESNVHVVHAGLWSCDDRVTFYAPRERAHDSWSAVNVQETPEEDAREFDVVSLGTVALQHPDVMGRRPAVLKLNIEGAEAEVLRNLHDSPVEFDVIAVHLESVSQVRLRSPGRFLREARSGLRIGRQLRRAGYRVARTANLQMCLVRSGNALQSVSEQGPSTK